MSDENVEVVPEIQTAETENADIVEKTVYFKLGEKKYYVKWMSKKTPDEMNSSMGPTSSASSETAEEAIPTIITNDAEVTENNPGMEIKDVASTPKETNVISEVVIAQKAFEIEITKENPKAQSKNVPAIKNDEEYSDISFLGRGSDTQIIKIIAVTKITEVTTGPREKSEKASKTEKIGHIPEIMATEKTIKKEGSGDALETKKPLVNVEIKLPEEAPALEYIGKASKMGKTGHVLELKKTEKAPETDMIELAPKVKKPRLSLRLQVIEEAPELEITEQRPKIDADAEIAGDASKMEKTGTVPEMKKTDSAGKMEIIDDAPKAKKPRLSLKLQVIEEAPELEITEEGPAKIDTDVEISEKASRMKKIGNVPEMNKSEKAKGVMIIEDSLEAKKHKISSEFKLTTTQANEAPGAEITDKAGRKKKIAYGPEIMISVNALEMEDASDIKEFKISSEIMITEGPPKAETIGKSTAKKAGNVLEMKETGDARTMVITGNAPSMKKFKIGPKMELIIEALEIKFDDECPKVKKNEERSKMMMNEGSKLEITEEIAEVPTTDLAIKSEEIDGNLEMNTPEKEITAGDLETIIDIKSEMTEEYPENLIFLESPELQVDEESPEIDDSQMNMLEEALEIELFIGAPEIEMNLTEETDDLKKIYDLEENENGPKVETTDETEDSENVAEIKIDISETDNLEETSEADNSEVISVKANPAVLSDDEIFKKPLVPDRY